jgi:hypothetical protein
MSSFGPVDVDENLGFFLDESSRVISFSCSLFFFSILKEYNLRRRVLAH